MPAIELTDVVEARRAKRALLTGRVASLRLDGQCVTGIVHSVLQVSRVAPRWVVAFEAVRAAKDRPAVRYNPHKQMFVVQRT